MGSVKELLDCADYNDTEVGPLGQILARGLRNQYLALKKGGADDEDDVDEFLEAHPDHPEFELHLDF